MTDNIIQLSNDERDREVPFTPRDYRLVSEDGVASPAQLQRMQDNWSRQKQRAPETTVDAVIFSFRSRGMAALSEPVTRQRLSELSKEQVGEVAVRLDRLRAKYPTITDQVIVELGKYYEAD